MATIPRHTAAARRQFGNPTRIRETCRELWTFAALETLWQDLRYAARTLARTPAFSVVAVLSLALGIGANAALFSLMDVMLLRALPVKNPQELVEFVRATPRWRHDDESPLPGLRVFSPGPQRALGRFRDWPVESGVPSRRHHGTRQGARSFRLLLSVAGSPGSHGTHHRPGRRPGWRSQSRGSNQLRVLEPAVRKRSGSS